MLNHSKIIFIFVKNNVMNLNNTKFVYSENNCHVKKRGDAIK